ncbi:MAG: hybrid sensor histidine kinase/response regulator [Archangiaceae bacterium]|nr:hybrid sensor histidine kinase/response regulator [Archangiaceae bacterium]
MSQRARVLVVDDDDDVRRLSKLRLREHYEVLEADSGPAALEAIATQQVDLVLMDVMMPGMTGLETCRRIKAQPRDTFLPVVLLTALDDQDSRNRGLDAGADDYLSKPIDAVELQLRVRHLLDLRAKDQLIHQQVGELERLAGLRDELVSLMVHDLRNPLVGVLGALQLIQQTTSLDEADARLVELGLMSTERVMELTGDLLRMRMLEDGALALQREAVPLDELARLAVSTLAPEAERAKVAISVRAEGEVKLAVDRKLVQRAVENLLSNAVAHTRGSIDITVTARDHGAVMEIADRGAGVPDALKPGLFQKYGSVEMMKHKARRGHGLGLYLVALVAKAHGGSVEVRDREGGGAVFRLELKGP